MSFWIAFGRTRSSTKLRTVSWIRRCSSVRSKSMAPSLLTAWERLAALTVEVERIELERLERQVSSGFRRVTTVIHLHGGGEEGVGEDVTYVAALHDGLSPPSGLEGTRPLGELTELIGSTDLFPVAPEHDVYR